MNGKGSTRRPRYVSIEEFEKNWIRVFKPKRRLTQKSLQETYDTLSRSPIHLDCIGTDKCKISNETQDIQY